jgi:transposase-like protein
MRKRYSTEFKRAAVARFASGESYSQVCKDTGVSDNKLRDWEKGFEADGRERPAKKAELDEIRRPMRELNRAKKDNDIF